MRFHIKNKADVLIPYCIAGTSLETFASMCLGASMLLGGKDLWCLRTCAFYIRICCMWLLLLLKMHT